MCYYTDMLPQRGKEYIAGVAGGYAGYKVGGILLPFVILLFLFGVICGGIQCAYRSVTDAPAIIEPQIDPEFRHESR